MKPQQPKLPQPDQSDVGDRYSLTIERHSKRPLWRLKQRTMIGGKVREKSTAWAKFKDFSPDVVECQGDLRRFLFADVLGARIPTAHRNG